MPFVKGVDISGDFQSVDSFHDLLGAGFEFVFVKATEGATFSAGRFAEYRDRIRETDGMLFGAYHFTSWNDDPVAQARHFLATYTPQNGDLPPMLDCEAFTVPPDRATSIIATILQTVEPHLGAARMLLYTSFDSINTQKFATDDFAGHPLWIAEYNSDPAPTIPRTWRNATIWQNSDGSGLPLPPGVRGRACDRDRFLGTADQLRALVLHGI